MIVGIGTDILQISRIDEALERTPKLAERILTTDELSVYLAESQPARFLAKRFAAKEAVAKALGTGIGRGVSWQHIQIKKDEFGKPEVSLTAGAAERACEIGISNVQLSYSDEREYIVAFVIAEG
ncbi:MAG: holo-ACP synthase [Neptuniibacter sp.]